MKRNASLEMKESVCVPMAALSHDVVCGMRVAR